MTKRAMEQVIDDVAAELGCDYDDLFDKVMAGPLSLSMAEYQAIANHKDGWLFAANWGD